MQEVFEKIIDQLKAESIIVDDEAGNRAVEIIEQIAAEYNNGWVKVEYHELTEEERKEKFIADEITYFLDCRLPEDEEEIICTDGKNVWVDTNWIDDGYSLDSGRDWQDIIAWQPLLEPCRVE